MQVSEKYLFGWMGKDLAYLRLNDELHALNRGCARLGNSARHTTGKEVNQKAGIRHIKDRLYLRLCDRM